MTELDALLRARSLLEEPEARVAGVVDRPVASSPPSVFSALALSGVAAVLALSTAALVIFAPPPPTETGRR